MAGGRRVAVTGLGVVAPTGIGREAFWNGLLGPGVTSGQSITIDDWDPAPYFDNPKQARRTDRVEQFALAAAGGALLGRIIDKENKDNGTLIGLEYGGRSVAGVIELPALDERVFAAQGQGCFLERGTASPVPARVSAVDRLHEALVCVTDISGFDATERGEALEPAISAPQKPPLRQP